MTSTEIVAHSALVVGGGQAPNRVRLARLCRTHETIIAVDSGLRLLTAIGVRPHLVIGDFDSVTPEELAAVPAALRRHEPSQEDTDLEKAIRVALARGATRIGLAATSGGRIDHTLYALSLMIRYGDRAQLRLHDAFGEGSLVGAPEVTIHGRPGEKLSLVPAPAAYQLESTGLKYPLGGMDLVLGGRDAISNELVATEARITLDSGRFLLYRQSEES